MFEQTINLAANVHTGHLVEVLNGIFCLRHFEMPFGTTYTVGGIPVGFYTVEDLRDSKGLHRLSQEVLIRGLY